MAKKNIASTERRAKLLVGIIKKEEYVCTVLAWAIAHELFHADQAIQMVMYMQNL